MVAGVSRKASRRGSPWRRFSTLTPYQTFGSLAIHDNSSFKSRCMRSWRFVSTWKVCRRTSLITCPISAMYDAGTRE